jgi:hypothetical protein
MKHARYRFLLLPLFLALACVGAFAQANSAVTGIVTDQTGAVVADAKIVLTDPATGATKTTVSSGTGLYNIPGLNAANYNMKVTANGFQTFQQNGIVVNISATFRVDVKLTVGAESQTVTVQADALAVQSDSNVVSTLINEQQITELATNGRNIVALAAMGMGVSGNLPDFNIPASSGASSDLSFNGLDRAHNIWLIDGGEAMDRGSGGSPSLMPSQDALGEFQVLTSNYPPDYGISSGGTITMSIKSGTKKFHGELWEFDRNDALQAHNYFDQPSAKKPELRMNIYGGNVGGPLFIPHVYNSAKSKTFFFYNEEWRKIVQGSSPAGINAIPAADFITSAQNVNWVLPAHASSAFRALPVNATHGQVVVPTVDPNTPLAKNIATDGLTMGQSFPDNYIPANLFLDPSALAFNGVGAIPKANAAGDTVVVPSKQPLNVREDLFRIDHNINDKWKLFGHYIGDSVSQTFATSAWSSDSYPTVGSAMTNPSWSSVVKLTGELTPKALLEAAFNFTGNKLKFQPTGTAFTKPSGWPGQSFFPAANDALNRLPTVSLGSYGTSFDPWVQPYRNAAMEYAEVFGLSITQGKHNLKFGGGYSRFIKNQIVAGRDQGSFNFSDGYTSGNGSTVGHINNANLTGDSYLDFLLGLSTSYSQLESSTMMYYVNQTISAYAQDNWHVNNRLSLQYGIRYDMMPHTWERHNRLASFDPSQYQQGLTQASDFLPSGAFACPAADVTAGCGALTNGLRSYPAGVFYMNGVTIAGQNGVPRGMVKNFYKTYMPRVGFSYDIAGNGKTVLRGGFGTFFERMQGNDAFSLANGVPFSNTPAVSNTTFNNPLANWQFGTSLSTATLPVVPQGMTTISTTYPAPGVAQFSLGVQHEIVPSLILITQYVGNVGWHQSVITPINEYPLNTPMQFRADSAGDKTYPGYAAPTTVQGIMARTYPGFGNIQEQATRATTSYNSFQAGLRQESRHGLSFDIDYTWSHEIDSQLGSNDLAQSVSNPWNLRYDRGSGNLDRRQILNVNYIYKLPIFAHSNGLTHSVLGGWTVSGTMISQTGLPWAGSNAPGDGGSDTVGLGGDYTIRPNFAGKVMYPKKRNAKGVYQWVSAAGFSQPTAAWNGGPNLGFGNASRDIVVGPGRTNFGINLYKSFALGERAHFEFRAESFNTFNHTQFNGFHNNVSGSDFGEVNSVQDPRTFELAGKFVF